MSKFQIDDTINIGGSLKVTGVQRHKTGTFFYNVNFGGDNITLTERAILQMQSTGIRANPFCAETITKQEDKPKFVVGQKVKIVREGQKYPSYKEWFEISKIDRSIARRFNHGKTITDGDIVTVVASGMHERKSDGMLYAVETEAGGVYIISEKGIEPYTEPEQPKEPIVLYCVKDFKPGEFLTKGKIYEAINSKLCLDDGFNASYSRMTGISKGISWADCLIKTEKRQAKVGEYVLLTNDGIWMGKRYSTGEIYQINHINSQNTDRCYFNFLKPDELFFKSSEYLVLPDYQPEKVEPTYLNMKVVCTESDESWWIAGKPYDVVDGVIHDESNQPRERIDNIAALNKRMLCTAKFIPYLGEQSC